MILFSINHLRRAIVSRPFICAPAQQSAINSALCIYSTSCTKYPSLYNSSISQCMHHLRKEDAQSPTYLYKSYSTCCHNRFNCLTNDIFKFSNKASLTHYNSNTCFHRKNQKSPLLLPVSPFEDVVLSRKSHHLTRKLYRHAIVTRRAQDLQSGLFGKPEKVHPNSTRGINLAKHVLDASPTSWQPYIQLIRLDKPIGTWLLFWPCSWSIALAAQPGCWPDAYYLALFGAGAFFMRGAGCIINDMWDKDFDLKVERTKDRPLASDRVSYPQALAFLASQLSISLLILLQLNWYSICLGVASLGLVILYPTFKRFTYWPQVALGLTFNFGTLLGWAAVRGSCDWSVCIPLFFLGHMWTMIYDTIYAHQDKSDDILAGVKSTALRLGDQTKPWLVSFTAAMAGGLLTVGHFNDMTWPYYTGATLTISSILLQLYRLDIDNPQACGDAFRFHFYIGLLMFASIVLSNLVKPKEKNRSTSNDSVPLH